jgi:hypothetical protein
MRNWKCTECDTVWQDDKLLTAKNPFEEDGILVGCPSCKSINSFVLCCDEDGCTTAATIGFMQKDEYRCTCQKHARKTKRLTNVTN